MANDSAAIAVSLGQRRGWLVVAVYLLTACLGALSVSADFRHADEAMATLARERGAVLFRLVELTRDWSTLHGGVYVQVSELGQPNPYLEHPRRDLVATDGTRLTLINPAYMTRQIAEIAEKTDGVRYHITSLKPIRPANLPDAWEAETLAMFDTGRQRERLSLINNNDMPVHRYMAPLFVKEACLQCHLKQEYRIGQVRGGISVSMPAADALKVRDQQRRRALMVTSAACLTIALLLHFIIARTRHHFVALEALAAGQEQLIRDRTLALSQSNASLQAEVEERKRRENALLVADAVMQNAAEGIVVIDGERRVIDVNPAFSVFFGYRPSEVIGTQAITLIREGHDDAALAEIRQSLHDKGYWQGELWGVRKDGVQFPLQAAIARIGEAQAGVGRYVLTFSDITERKENEARLKYRASVDPLTGLANRTTFDERLQHVLAQAGREQSSFALIYIDLDRFKPVNDRYGHAVGDELLVEVARRLHALVRETDVVARLGGDEFVVIVTRAGSPARVEDIARRIVADLAAPYQLGVEITGVSASLGIALFPLHGTQAEELKRNADVALYEAKAAGRNTYRISSNWR